MKEVIINALPHPCYCGRGYEQIDVYRENAVIKNVLMCGWNGHQIKNPLTKK